MAGGLPNNGIDFGSIFMAYQGARDAAERRGQMQWERQRVERQDKLQADAAAAQAKQQQTEKSALAGLYAQPDSPEAQQALMQASPKLYGETTQQLSAMRTAQNTETQARIERTAKMQQQAADILQRDPSAAPKVQETLNRLQAAGHIDPIQLPGHALPEGMAGPQMAPTPEEAGALRSQGEIVTGPPKPVERKTTGDMLETASRLGYHEDIGAAEKDPRWSSMLDRVSSSKAIQINNGQTALGERSKALAVRELQEASDLRGLIARIKSFGDPSKYLTSGAKTESALVGAAAKYAPGFVGEDAAREHAAHAQYDALLKDLASRASSSFSDEEGGGVIQNFAHEIIGGGVDPIALPGLLDQLDDRAKSRIASRQEILGQGVNLTDPNHRYENQPVGKAPPGPGRAAAPVAPRMANPTAPDTSDAMAGQPESPPAQRGGSGDVVTGDAVIGQPPPKAALDVGQRVAQLAGDPNNKLSPDAIANRVRIEFNLTKEQAAKIAGRLVARQSAASAAQSAAGVVSGK